MVITISKGIMFASIVTLFFCYMWKKNRRHLMNLDQVQKYAFIIFIFWSFLVFYMTLLSFTCDPIVISTVGFTPFHTLKEIYRYGMLDMAYQLIFNILMFLPFGMLLPIIFNWAKKLSKTAAFGFCLSLAIETTQMFIGRSFDIDDILCNALGAVLGYGLYVVFISVLKMMHHQPLEKKQKVTSVITIANLAMLAIYPYTF